MKRHSVSDLKTAMKKGQVKFQYTKKNGEIRTATGTMNREYIESRYTYKGGEGPSRYGYTTYWDVEKDAFRCFLDDKFIGICEA